MGTSETRSRRRGLVGVSKQVRNGTGDTYVVRVADAQGHGGEPYAYRLRLSAPRPDFTVFVTPASVNVAAGDTVPITVHAVRRDGFDGAIELSLRDAPRGIILSGARIPAGRNRITMTLGAPLSQSLASFTTARHVEELG